MRLSNTQEPSRTVRTLAVALVMTITVLWLYRQQIGNSFSILAGDRYDGVISTTILEHWYNVVRGRANWAEVGYFFPYSRVIAQTDAYFILGILYAPFRFLGFDEFVSAELVNMVVKGIGFIATYAMCRRVFNLPFFHSLLAATLFTLSNGMTTHSSRSQLATVAFVPIMVLLLSTACRALTAGQLSTFRKYGIAAGVLFGAWCLTCFYVAWFFGFFTLVMLIVAAWQGGRQSVVRAAQVVSKNYPSFVVVFGAALLALAPFLYAFVPKARETGTRHLGEALQFTVPLHNIFQVGNENLFLGKIYNVLLLKIQPDYVPQHEYYNTGFAIVLFILFLAGAVHLYRRAKAKQDFFLVCIMLTTLVTWLMTLNIKGYSLWFFPFYLIPGARALRVVAAYEIFLVLPIVVIAMWYLTRVNIRRAALFVLAIVLVLEELNAPALGLDRQAELARIALPTAPPKECRSFYTSAWKDQASLPGPADIYAHNVSAMLIAQKIQLPTVNGVASFQPKDWDFAKPQQPDYDARVASYASKHALTGLCKLDLNDKTWSVVPPSSVQLLPLDVGFFKKSAWQGGIAETHGLSAPEAWGAWSNDDVVRLDFTQPLPARFALHLSAGAFAHNIGKEFTVLLGGSQTAKAVGTFTLVAEPEERVLSIDNPSQARTLTIRVPHPVSPLELGATDDRRLGIAFHELKIVPLPPAPALATGSR